MSDAGYNSDDGFNEFELDAEHEDLGLAGEEGEVPMGEAAGTAGRPGGPPLELPPPPVNVAELFPRSDRLARPRCVMCLAYVNLHTTVDLRELSCNVCNIEFNPAKANAAIMRIRDPSCVALIRNTGIVSLTGASSVPAAKRATEIIARVIRKALNKGPEMTKVTFRVKSLTIHFDLKHPIRLEDFQTRYPANCSYEPESFCGCVVRLNGPPSNPWRVACTVFVSGKVSIMGAQTAFQVECAYNTLLPMLAPFAMHGSQYKSAPASQA